MGQSPYGPSTAPGRFRWLGLSAAVTRAKGPGQAGGERNSRNPVPQNALVCRSQLRQPELGTLDHATSQPARCAQPAMATAGVGGLPGTCRADPILDQIAGLGLDDGLFHGGVPSDLVLVGRAISWAPSRSRRTSRRGSDTRGKSFRADFEQASASVGRRRTNACVFCRLDSSGITCRVIPAPLCCQPIVRAGVFRVSDCGCSVGSAGPGSG